MKLIALTLCAACAGTSLSASQMVVLYDGDFPRFPAEIRVGAPPGQSVAEHCAGAAEAANWPDASATLRLEQNAQASRVTVNVRNARPDTLYSMWLRLSGVDATGEFYGGNPLVGIPGTALLPSNQLDRALNVMQTPEPGAMNGFMADGQGNGSVTIDLDFPIVGGAYPFQRLAGFDPTDARYTVDKPQAIPVAVTGKAAGAPFTLRLSSHCVDNLSHGIIAGPHEAWFDWLAP